MSQPSAADLDAWRHLAAMPFAPIPTFAPSTSGVPSTFSPSYDGSASLLGANALTAGTTITLRPVTTNNMGAWIGLGACLLLALTGVGVVVLIGYLFWFIPRITKSGRQPMSCPRCGRQMSVANGAVDVQCSSCSTRSSVSWSR